MVPLMVFSIIISGFSVLLWNDIDPIEKPIAYKVGGMVIIILIICFLIGLIGTAIEFKSIPGIIENNEINQMKKEIEELNKTINIYLQGNKC